MNHLQSHAHVNNGFDATHPMWGVAWRGPGWLAAGCAGGSAGGHVRARPPRGHAAPRRSRAAGGRGGSATRTATALHRRHSRASASRWRGHCMNAPAASWTLQCGCTPAASPPSLHPLPLADPQHDGPPSPPTPSPYSAANAPPPPPAAAFPLCWTTPSQRPPTPGAGLRDQRGAAGAAAGARAAAAGAAGGRARGRARLLRALPHRAAAHGAAQQLRVQAAGAGRWPAGRLACPCRDRAGKGRRLLVCPSSRSSHFLWPACRQSWCWLKRHTRRPAPWCPNLQTPKLAAAQATARHTLGPSSGPAALRRFRRPSWPPP